MSSAVPPPRLNEFAILITAREWDSQSEWYAHHRLALQGGLNPAVAADLAEGKRPAGMQENETIVYNFCTVLHRARKVSDATYRAALDKFGEVAAADRRRRQHADRAGGHRSGVRQDIAEHVGRDHHVESQCSFRMVRLLAVPRLVYTTATSSGRMVRMKRLAMAVFVAWTTCLWAAGTALAVPDGAASATAELVCELRALAAQHPDPKLRSGDLLAARLCPASMLPREYAQARRIIDAQPERFVAFFFVNGRTLHIDALLERAAAQGVTQVVVLGAGFDSRAYRFHDGHPKLRFFEVDLPATINLKKKRVIRMLGALPRHVRYAPIDFNTQSLDQVLRRAGYDPAKKTFFILEGVTMYVNEAGNRATLRFIRKHSPSGSMLVYDYVLRRVIDGDFADLYAARQQAEGVAYIGEPFITGWTPKQATEFARDQGLVVLDDLGSEELTRRYLTGSDGRPDGRTTDWQRIIDAIVP